MEHYLDNLRPSNHDDEGYIYLMINPSMPYRVKIGYTTKVREVRAKQLFTTGVPEPFEVYESWFVTEMKTVETLCHDLMRNYRVHPRREFFNVDTQEQLYFCEDTGVEYNEGKEYLMSLVDFLESNVQAQGYVFQNSNLHRLATEEQNT